MLLIALAVLAAVVRAAPQCSEYARLGYCTQAKYRKYMERHCASSCQVGTAVTGEEDEQCTKWASEGYCEHAQYKDYMSRECPRSCGLDPQAAVPATDSAAEKEEEEQEEDGDA